MNTILCNGLQWSLDETLTVAEVLERVGLAGRRVAIQRNGKVVPRSSQPGTFVGDGDRIEIIVAVGGG